MNHIHISCKVFCFDIYLEISQFTKLFEIHSGVYSAAVTDFLFLFTSNLNIAIPPRLFVSPPLQYVELLLG